MSLSIETLKHTNPEPTNTFAKKAASETMEAKVIFLGENFVDNCAFSSDLDLDLAKENLCRRYIQIHPAESGDFNYTKSGFEIVNLPGSMLNAVHQYASNPLNSDFELNLLKSSSEYFSEWAEIQGLKFKDVVPFNLVNRSEDELDKINAKPFPCAHIDFNPDRLQSTFQESIEIFKPYCEKTLGPLTVEEYLKLFSQVKMTFNLWLSLNSRPTLSTLGMLVPGSFNPEDLRPCKFGTNTMSIHFKPDQVWVADHKMKIGKGICFNSQEIIHSGFKLEPKDSELEREYDLNRRSVEIRFGLIEDKHN